MKNRALKRPLLMFFLLAYLIFWGMLALTAVVVLVLGAPSWVEYILPVICAWSPTFAFLLMFRRLYPGMTPGAYIRGQFSTRVNIPLLTAAAAAQVLIIAAAVCAYSIINKATVLSVVTFSADVILLAFIDQLIRGPLGEELGWRGYALNALQKRFSPLVSAVALGLLWGVWHAPLWFLTSGLSGEALAWYICVFMITIVSLSIIITAVYNLNRNLLLPMLLHQMFNYLTKYVSGGAFETVFRYVGIGYVLLALILVLVNPQHALYGKKDAPVNGAQEIA